MSRRRSGEAARRIIDDPELLTRTSWVDAGTAYHQVCKVRPPDRPTDRRTKRHLAARQTGARVSTGRGLQFRGVGEF